jgi:transcriptional regulator with XRE-family HTH domain
MEELLKIFAERIKMLREEYGLGVREEAAKIGISHSAISRYENCQRTPDIIVVNLFADFFDVSGDFLLGRTDIRK